MRFMPPAGVVLAKMKMPLLMGSVMGLMMLWMLHGVLTGQSEVSGPAALVFIGAHVVAVAVLILGGVFATRLSPGLQARLKRMHRPSLRHVSVMLASAAVSAALAHLVIHGGLT
ncbi:MAG: hypothetical protein AAGL89_08150 [Pseudomonadota bacterium]